VAVGMIGVMVPNAFADEIPLDAKEKILEQKIPTWLKSVGGLLLENKITNDEFDNVLKFLIKTEILSSEQTSFKNFITGIEFHSNYNAIKNLQLNTQATKIIETNPRDVCIKLAMKDSKLTATERSACHRIDREYVGIIADDSPWVGLHEKKTVATNTQATKIIETNPRDVCIKLAMEDSKLTATERSACHRIDREYNWGFQDDSSAETIANMIPAKGLPPTYTYGGSVNASCSISYLDERTEHYVQKIDDWMRPEHNAYESGMMSYDELYEENQRITEYYTQKYIDDISYVCR
jgi:hypothetical protein